MSTTDTSYASYLLRLRKVQNNHRAGWVASVQSTATGEQRSFPSIEALATFLLATYQCPTADGSLECGDEPEPRG